MAKESSNFIDLLAQNKTLYENFNSYVVPSIHNTLTQTEESAAFTQFLAKYVLEWSRFEDVIHSVVDSTIPVLIRHSELNIDQLKIQILELDSLFQFLNKHNLLTLSLVQRGLPMVFGHKNSNYDTFKLVLSFSKKLASNGIELVHPLSLGYITCLNIANKDNRELFKILTALQEFIIELDNHGISGTYPILTGISHMSGSYPIQSSFFISTLDKIFELCMALQKNKISPYPIIEYAISAAFQYCQNNLHLVNICLNLSISMAKVGNDPSPLLLHGIRNINCIPPPYQEKVVDALNNANQKHADTGIFTAYTLSKLWDFSNPRSYSKDDAYHLSMDALLLAQELSKRNFQQILSFEYALPSLISKDDISLQQLNHAIQLSIKMAKKDLDPGPIIDQGYNRAIILLGSNQKVNENLYDACNQIVDLGYSPLIFLSYGIPEIIKLSNKQTVALNEGINQFVGIYTKLNKLDIDLDLLFSSGMRELSSSFERNTHLLFDVFLGIEKLALSLDKNKLNLHNTLQKGIPSMGKAMEKHPDLVTPIFHIANEMANLKIEPYILFNSSLNKLLETLPLSASQLILFIEKLKGVVLLNSKHYNDEKDLFETILYHFDETTLPNIESCIFLCEQLNSVLSGLKVFPSALAIGFAAIYRTAIANDERDFLLHEFEDFLNHPNIWEAIMKP